MMLRRLSAAAQILPESHQRIHSFLVEFCADVWRREALGHL